MSFEYYSKWWAGTRKNLELLFQKDEEVVKMTNLKIKDRPRANQLVGSLYAKYSMIVQELGTILDQMAQPQKRIVVRKLMDAATIRLHELNEELRNIDISEYHYIDGALIELKLVPDEVEILDPILYYLRHYTLEELWNKIKNGERIYTPPPPPEKPPQSKELLIEEVEPKPEGEEGEAPVEEEAPQPPPPVEEDSKAKKRPKKFLPEGTTLTQQELDEIKRKDRVTAVVKIIQTHERGRQARIYFGEHFDKHEFTKKIRLGFKPEQIDPEKQEQSAVMMEKLWRGHSARQYVKRKEKERRFLIGMYEPSWKSTEEFEKFERNLQIRRDLRDQRIKEYIEANLNETCRVFRVIAPGLMEDIGDEIREWFRIWYTEVKNFDKFPTEEQGGTIVVIRGETLTPKQWIDEVERKRRQKARDKGKSKEKLKAELLKKKKLKEELKKKEKEKAKKERERKRKKHLKPWDFELEYEPTTAQEPFLKAINEYHEIFDERKDEDNPSERHYMDIIHEEKCYKMQLEVRKQVDVMMRLELEMLEDALARDRAKRGKKTKKKKPKKKKKGRKKKGKKDPTGNRTTEDLFQELVDNGIIHPYDKHYLKEYKGDFSYNNWNYRNKEFDPPSTLGDLRQLIKINCIAPLSTESMKKPRSVLLIGPRQSGKHLLANAIFTESQSVLFDLSPEILEGKYPEKKGMKMLLHLINKMSRLLQPSVIYFEKAERLFYKKVPMAERPLDPKRMGKKLLKGIVKTIKPQDRVLVFGMSGQPWLGKPNKLKKTFERIILMPRPDYGSIYLYWRELLMPYHGVDRNIDISCLAKLTKFFTLPDIKRAVEKVLTPQRIIQLSYNPLRQSELFEALINVNPITDKEYKKFLKFYSKVPLAKERNKFNKFAERTREAEARAKEKKK